SIDVRRRGWKWMASRPGRATRPPREPGPEPATRLHESVAPDRQGEGADDGQGVPERHLEVGLSEGALDRDEEWDVDKVDPEARVRQVAQRPRLLAHMAGEDPPDPEQHQPADQADRKEPDYPQPAVAGQDSGLTHIAGEVGVVVEEQKGGNRDQRSRRNPPPGA